MVIQIADGPEHAMLRAQHRGDRFLGCRLAGTAGDADKPLAPVPAYGGGECLHGYERVVDDEQGVLMGLGQHARCMGVRNDRGTGPSFERSGHEVMRIKSIAADGEEEIARLERARVNGVAGGWPARVLGVTGLDLGAGP